MERVVLVKRSAKASKGRPRFTFSALVVVGNGRGRVGFALGKSGEVANAISKGAQLALARMVDVSLKSETIPHEVCGTYCGAKVLVWPAPPGTGIIASKTVRAVLECAGVKDAVSKLLGAHNAANVVKATLQALVSLRRREQNEQVRGLKTKSAKVVILLKFPDLRSGGRPLQLN